MKGKILDETTAKKIKAAAREVFLSKGYDGATMQAIADVSRVNKALLHYYYRSKDGLFLLIFQEELQLFFQNGVDTFQDPKRPLLEKLETWIDAESRLLARIPKLPLFLLNEFHRNPDLVQGLVNELKIPMMARQLKSFFKEQKESRPGPGIGIDIEELFIMINSLLFFPILAAPLFQFLLGLSPKRWTEIQSRQAAFAKEMLKKYVG